MNQPKITVVMVDGHFRERFHSLEFLNKQNLPNQDYEIIWVEYTNQTNPKLDAIISQIPNARVLKLGHTDTYHSSRCFNAGISAARGELIVIPDADLAFEEDFLSSLWDDHSKWPNLVEYIYRFNEPKSWHKEKIDLPHLRSVTRITDPSNWGGVLSVRKKYLLEINGYDLHPVFSTGYHRNDIDVYNRLKALGLLVRWHPNLKAYHSWHPGTEGEPLEHALQKIVAYYRAQQQWHLPFIGIDSSKNYTLPKELQNLLDAKTEEYKQKSG